MIQVLSERTGLIRKGEKMISSRSMILQYGENAKAALPDRSGGASAVQSIAPPCAAETKGAGTWPPGRLVGSRLADRWRYRCSLCLPLHDYSHILVDPGSPCHRAGPAVCCSAAHVPHGRRVESTQPQHAACPLLVEQGCRAGAQHCSSRAPTVLRLKA